MNPALLAIETATDVCGIALHDGSRVVVSFSLRQRQQHARALVPLVAEAISHLPGGWDAVGAVAVSAGPGSYTGLRIGVSVAKGLCEARGLALVAVPSLDALAAQALPFTEPGDAVAALFNSRRGEVYVRWYRGGPALVPLDEPEALALDDLHSTVPEATRLWLVGEGARAAADELADLSPRVVPDALLLPDAASVARLGYERWQAGLTEDVSAFEPAYLKPFVARATAF